ncbi:MAG: DUF2628 domain-containing protein [Candidatus Accumulibacter sp.]|jgi:hypothetical protein|nr:DUF2628 domain-containing protein [Accumulibacter sp.]
MNCDQCGTAVQETTGFCPECDHPFKSAEDPALEDRQGTPAPSQEELFKAVIGPQNQSYYLERFQRFEKNGKAVSWNWSALIFPVCWFFYRKMWRIGILYVLLHVLLYLPLAFHSDPISYFPANFPSYLPVNFLLYVSKTSGNPLIVWACAFLLIGLALWPPLYANSMYYSHCKKLIAEVTTATALSAGRERQLAELSARGGTCGTVVFLYLAVFPAFVLVNSCVRSVNYSRVLPRGDSAYTR